MKVAIIGATGLVGQTMIKVLEERNFPVSELILVASENSVGNFLTFKGISYPIVSILDALKLSPNIALFSAGKPISLEYGPQFVAIGCRVIDNSSAWRMEKSIRLIVPEVNGFELTKQDMLIANPNCSTIQLVMVLAPIHKKYGIKRVVISTYQSVSGSGQPGIDELMDQRNGGTTTANYPYPIDLNVIPHIESFREDGYSYEEIKIIEETCKIMQDDAIKITATTVRVPVKIGHSESVNIELLYPFFESDIKDLLSTTSGVIVVDNPEMNGYPTPLETTGKDEVFVGRIRRDHTQPNTLNCWIVADNLRKGAATNAVQIAKLLHGKGWV